VDPLELAAVAAWSFAVAFAGGVAGLVLGNLRLPLVASLATSPAAGAGANVTISAVSALSAASAHARAGRVSWRLFWWMAPPSVVGGIVGGLVSGVLPGRVLLGVIAVVVLYGSVEVLRYGRSRREAAQPADGEPQGLMLNAAVVGFGVGVLGGLVGLILGSLRMPALLKWARVSPRAAVGTNAAIGMAVGLGGMIGHLPSGIDWGLVAAGCIGAIPGALMGARLVGRLDEWTLLRVVAAILVVAGLSMAVEAVVG
jgi:uncharacterized membrane protein YfcA